MPEDISENLEMSQFRRNLQRREQARIAFIRSDHDLRLRCSLLRRARPLRCPATPGRWVMLWREGKGALHGAWHGPAKVLMREDPHVVWLSHLSRLFGCAPEHIRELSSREQEQVPAEQSSQESPLQPFEGRLGTGVFQYHDLTRNNSPSLDNHNFHPDNQNVDQSEQPSSPATPDNIPPAVPQVAVDASPTDGQSENLQPTQNPKPWLLQLPHRLKMGLANSMPGRFQFRIQMVILRPVMLLRVMNGRSVGINSFVPIACQGIECFAPPMSMIVQSQSSGYQKIAKPRYAVPMEVHGKCQIDGPTTFKLIKPCQTNGMEPPRLQFYHNCKP